MDKRFVRQLLSGLCAFAMLCAVGCGGKPDPASSDAGQSGSSAADPTGSGISDIAPGVSGSTDATGGTQTKGNGSMDQNNSGDRKTTPAGTNSSGSVNTTQGGQTDPSAIDYTKGSKPAKRATKINGFVRRAGKYLIDEAGDEWFVKGGGIDCGSLAGKLEPNDTVCNEQLYKSHADIGCNTIRLTFNWEIFFVSKTSMKFNDNGFNWLKKNVEWAKKYNMRLILNMHRIPCGDEASGNMHQPNIFWNKSYQQRWKAVWREIARRFADEPVILAYSFWNEQNAPIEGTSQADSEKAYGDLYQECIDAVRTVDKRHMIVCEQIFAQQNQSGAYRNTVFPAFPPLKEKNLMYEYHCYEPMEYTYQDKSANQQKYPLKWADPNVISGAGLSNYQEKQSAAAADSGKLNAGYSEISSDEFTADAKVAAVSPMFWFNGATSGSSALEIKSVEIWDVTDNKRVYRCEFNSVNAVKTYFSYNPNTRSYSGALRFTDTVGMTVIQIDRVEIVKAVSGHKYKTVVQARGQNLPNGATLNVGARFWSGKAYINNIEALRVFHKRYVDYRDKNNIPVFCGEWGAFYDVYSDGLNAKQWAEDMLTMFKEYQMGFTVHTPFAMYSKAMQPWHYTGANPTFNGFEYTVLEDAFKKFLPTI